MGRPFMVCRNRAATSCMLNSMKPKPAGMPVILSRMSLTAASSPGAPARTASAAARCTRATPHHVTVVHAVWCTEALPPMPQRRGQRRHHRGHVTATGGTATHNRSLRRVTYTWR
jgi:hypothetical protein